jgi:DNA repair protein RadC
MTEQANPEDAGSGLGANGQRVGEAVLARLVEDEAQRPASSRLELVETYNTRILEMAPSDRPRERLRDIGAENLSTPELLAIVLRTGNAHQSALVLAQSLLKKHGGLNGLARLSFADLMTEAGIGEAKAAELKAVFRLAALIRELRPEDRRVVKTPVDVMDLVGDELAVLDQEHLLVILLNSRNQVMHVSKAYQGNVSAAIVRIAELFREAVRQNAPSVVFVHNHPSGDPHPSADDVSFTAAAVSAGNLLQIEVLDHIIIGDRQFHSMKLYNQGFP